MPYFFVVVTGSATGIRVGPIDETTPQQLGRDSSAGHLHVPGRAVSRNHALVTIRESHVLIQDLGSDNGTFVRGERLREKEQRPIEIGNVVLVGDTYLKLCHEPDDSRGSTTIVATEQVRDVVGVEEAHFALTAILKAQDADSVAAALSSVATDEGVDATLFTYEGTTLTDTLSTRGEVAYPDAARAALFSGKRAAFTFVAESEGVRHAGVAIAIPGRRCVPGVLVSVLARNAPPRSALWAAVAPVLAGRAVIEALGKRERGGKTEQSGAMQATLGAAWGVAKLPLTVLIQGETGAGKERIACYIHEWSGRCPLIAENVAAIPEGLRESILFGHENRSFNGALEHRGLLERAKGGTLFLDEIGELSTASQAALLRALDQGEFLRVGGTEPVHSDFRLITATRRDVLTLVQEGAFREDLYYRIAGATIRVPALRNRREDIRPLVEEVLAKQYHLLPDRVAEDAYTRLENHTYPGNVRELINVLGRAVARAGAGQIDAPCIVFDEPIPTDVAFAHALRDLVNRSSYFPTDRQVTETFAQLAVERMGTQTAAARHLGIAPNTLRARLDRAAPGE